MAQRRQRYSGVWLLLLVILSVGLMIVDHRSQYLAELRSGVALAVDPLREAASMPARFGAWISDFSRSQADIRESYQELRNRYLVLRTRLQKLESLEQENKRLSRLLSASEYVGEEVLLAELIEVSLEPFVHKVLVNRGAREGVYVGQPVIDPDGVFGQVTRVTGRTSAVTLLTDQSHAVPAQVRRNGLRLILYGLGVADRLSVPYLAQNADIREGDILITSGMGGRFPPGYPVARVFSIERNANEPFLEIEARPAARLDHAKEVLLIWHAVSPGSADSSSEMAARVAEEPGG